MKPTKKPPPDTVANIQGRILALKAGVRGRARIDAQNGADFAKALAKHSREVEPKLQKLRGRLAKIQRVASASGKTAETAPRNAQKRPKRRQGTKPGKESNDLLDVLDAL